jgi:hypothetical protein
MPTVLRFAGYRFFFFSNEGAEPPHVHVESAGCYAKFWLEPVTLADSVGYNEPEQKRLKKIVTLHVTLFSERWNEHFGG